MLAGFKGRMTALLIAAALVGGAVIVRVWLAATKGYSEGAASVPLRVASGLALFLGLALAALAVAWPMRRPGGPGKSGGNSMRRDLGLALVISLAGTAVVGGVLLLLQQNVWLVALGGLASLLGAGVYLGRQSGEPEPLYGTLLAVLYFGVVAGILFGGELAEALPDPLPGLAIGDSTFFFVWPLLMLMASVLGTILGGQWLRRKQKDAPQGDP